VTDWNHILAPADDIDELADHLGKDIQFSGKPPARLIGAIHSAVLIMTMIERSGLFRFLTWIFILASLFGVIVGSNRSAWAVSALTGMLILVTQSMTNATRRMAEISHNSSERDRMRSMVKWQAYQDKEDPRIVVLTNISLTTAMEVGISYNEIGIEGATAGLANVGPGMEVRFRLNHDPDFERAHWLRVFWQDRWSDRDNGKNATVYIIPSNGVMLRYPSKDPQE